MYAKYVANIGNVILICVLITIHLQSLSDKRRHAYAFIYSLPTFRNFRPLSTSSYRGTGTKYRIQQGEHDEESDINRITLKATPRHANRFCFN